MANPTDAKQPQTVGEHLRLARLRAGVSLTDVSQQLNISSRHLQALEQDKGDEHLPLTFANGYLRSYARYLGVESEVAPLRTAYLQTQESIRSSEPSSEQGTPGANPSRTGLRTTAWMLSSGYQHRTHRTYHGLVIAGLVAAAVWYVQEQPQGPLPQQKDVMVVEVTTPQGSVVEDLVPAPDTHSPLFDNGLVSSLVSWPQAGGGEGEMTIPVPAGSDRSPLASQPLAAVVSYDAHALQQQAETVLTAGATDVGQVSAHGESELSFYFSADCWISVVDGDNKTIYQHVAQARESVLLKGKPPFQVTLGYAPAVTLVYNGEPVSIGAKGRSNVARLVLGSS